MNPNTTRQSPFWQDWTTPIVIALLVTIALLLGWFVQRSVTQIRDALAEEVLQQQNDVAQLLHEYARVMLALERSSNNPAGDFLEIDTAMGAANQQLQKMRFQYSFERLDGAASAHAFVKPVLEDVAQWLAKGIARLKPTDPLTIKIAAQRMADRYESLRDIASGADQVAATLLEEQSASLDRFRKTLLIMLALTVLSWLGIVASLIRQRNLQIRLRIDGQRHAQRIADFADLGADWFWETNKRQKMQMLSGPTQLPPSDQPLAIDQAAPTPDHQEFLTHLPQQALLAQLPFIEHEFSWTPTDGSSQLLAVSGKPLYGKRGEFLGYRGIGRDITQRKKTENELERVNAQLLDAQKRGRQQAEQAQQDSEQFLRNSLDALTANIAILDSNGNIIATNRAWNSFANTDDGEITQGGVGKHYRDVFQARPASERAGIRAATTQINDVLGARRKDLYHELAFNIAGQVRWIALHLTTFNSNNSLYSVMVYDDVSERKNLEERDRKLRAEVAHTARLSTAGEMASGLAHELNQPLTAISHNCDALLYATQETTVPPDVLKETLSDIYSQAQRAGRIIHSIRQMVQKNTVVATRVDINELVNDTVRLTRAESTEHRIEVQLQLEPNLPLVQIDSVQIQQVLLNLERNALESIRNAKAERRRIVISTRREAEAIRVSVLDTGPGIDQQIKDKLFTSFQTTKENGMGMGLSISRSIVEAHGGNMQVIAESPGLTEFSFTLPIEPE